MAGGTSILGFTDGQIKMRWREPYLTEGINKKGAAVVPRGIYRGFRLRAGVNPMEVTVEADALGDHVAVFETFTAADERYSVRVEMTTGDFPISVAVPAWAGQTVYVAIYAEYSLLAASAASLRVYTPAEYLLAAEKDQLIILGTVAVPAVPGMIPDVDITANFRTLPWKETMPGAADPFSIVFDGSWDQGPPGTVRAGSAFATALAEWNETLPFWAPVLTVSVGTGELRLVDTPVHSAGGQALQLYASGAGNVVFDLLLMAHQASVPVAEGDEVHVDLWYRPLFLLNSGAAYVAVQLHDTDPIGASLIVNLGTLDLTVSADWVRFSGSIRVPAGYTRLGRLLVVSADMSGVPVLTPLDYTPAAATGVLVMDDCQMWVERAPGENPLAWSSRGGVGSFRLLAFEEAGVPPGGQALWDPLLADEAAVLPGALCFARTSTSHAHPTQPIVQAPRFWAGPPDGTAPASALADKALFRAHANPGAAQWRPVLASAGQASDAALAAWYNRKGEAALSLLVNAVFGNAAATWNYGGVPAGEALKVEIGEGNTHPVTAEPFIGLMVSRQDAGGAAWADNAWSYVPVVLPCSLAGIADEETMLGRIYSGIDLGEGLRDLYAVKSDACMVPRLRTRRDTGAVKTLIWEMAVDTAGEVAIRFYQTSEGNLEITVNARYDDNALPVAKWAADDTSAGSFASRTVLYAGTASDTSFAHYTFNTDTGGGGGAAAWAEASWATTDSWVEIERWGTGVLAARMHALGGVRYSSVFELLGSADANDYSHLRIEKSNPAYNSALIAENRLYAKNITKAWAQLETDGAGNVAVNGGFNIASAAIAGASNEIVRVTLGLPLASVAEACPVATINGVVFVWPVVTGPLVVDLLVYDTAGNPVNLNALALLIYFHLDGAQ